MAEPLFVDSLNSVSIGAALVLAYTTLLLGYLVGWLACDLYNDRK